MAPCREPFTLVGGFARGCYSRGMVVKRHSRPPIFRGEAHGNAKLTAAQVLAIRAQANRTCAALAAEYGVSIGTIKSVRSGQSWKHLLP